MTDNEYYSRCSYMAYFLQEHDATSFHAPQKDIYEYSPSDKFMETPIKVGYVESFEYSLKIDNTITIVYIESNRFIKGVHEDGTRIIKMKWNNKSEVTFNVFKREDRPGLTDYFQEAYDHIRTLEIAESLFEF